MKAKKRYCFLLSCIVAIGISIYLWFSWTSSNETYPKQPGGFFLGKNSNRSALTNKLDTFAPSNGSNCAPNSCFNFTRCRGSFKIYVYPLDDEEYRMKKYFKTDKWQTSRTYNKILNVLKNSKFYTTDPTEACLFILSFDTLDRDPLSQDFVPNLDIAINNLPKGLWNQGQNHLIFNLYTGTWPDYGSKEFRADFGSAIIAKASFPINDFRPDFDVSLPLFSSDSPETIHELYKREVPMLQCKSTFTRKTDSVYTNPSYLLTFKGKRYVHGIGSESRNALYHLHNNRDVIILTTCKHGKNWEKMKDERCDTDNSIYQQFDYLELMKNSTFCLIPRGRRLGSYRFLEALKLGCIPVILANGWVPPFSDVINIDLGMNSRKFSLIELLTTVFKDWKLAIVVADERSIFQIPEMLRSVSPEKILQMKRQVKMLYHAYFSTVENIVLTTIEIIKNRLGSYPKPSQADWNHRRGGVWSFFHGKTDNPLVLPSSQSAKLTSHFTVIINLFKPFHGYMLRMKKLLNALLTLKNLHKVYVLVHFSRTNEILAKRNVPQIEILTKDNKSQGIYYGFNLEIYSSAVVILDARFKFESNDLQLALRYFWSHPNRLVGFCGLDEEFAEADDVFKLVDSSGPCYSLVSDVFVIVHRYYFDWLRFYEPVFPSLNDEHTLCTDLILNAVVNRFDEEEGAMRLQTSSGACFANFSHENQPSNYRTIYLNRKQRCFEAFILRNSHLRLGQRFCQNRLCSK